MKRKRIFSTLLLGALVVASTSMFTSCKDYDDDINDLQSQIDGLTPAINTVKSDLEKEIASLKTQLETADGNLKTLITNAQNTADANATNLAAEIKRATASEASLEARLKTAEDALKSINDVLADKVDKKAFNDSIVSIYAKLEAVQTDLGSALTRVTTLESGLASNVTKTAEVAADLAQQKTALDNYKTRLEAIENAGYLNSTQVGTLINTAITDLKNGQLKDMQDDIDQLLKDVSTINGNITDINGNITTINGKIDGINGTITTISGDISKLKEADTALDGKISALTSDLQALSKKVDGIQVEVDALNVLLWQSLRSLVFIPESYYWGVEATKLLYLSYDQYTVPAAAWNVKETKGYSDDTRYPHAAGTKVLDFAATYNMNPSSADLKGATVSVLSGDKNFVLDFGTRAAACGLSVKDWSTADGILSVNFDVKNPRLIKSVGNDGMITNFATQVKLNKAGDKDTTITSDYATLYKFEVSHLKLSHKANTETNPIPLYADAPVSAISPCDIETAHGHLMQTVHEAGVTKAPQDSCNWNETLDLRKLVETHYTGTDGTHAVLTDEAIAANFDYKFELTYFTKGENATDESAHAAISSDGYTFRPQAVDKEGNQLAYGSEQNRASEVGRTPMIRVSLVDKSTGKVVYDYGYICIKITEKKEAKADKYITYTGNGYTYSGECTPLSWSYATTWNVTEADLYKELGLTREEFEANYGAPVGDSEDLTQYVLNKNNTFSELITKIGAASTVTDKTTSGDGTMSSTLKWEMTGVQAYKFFITDKKAGTGIAIKYASKDKGVGPDIYVMFKTGAALTVNTPSGAVAWDKNSTVWAATNATETGTGLDEIHVNVPSVEDGKTTVAKPFEQLFSNVFVGNKVSPAVTVANDMTADHEYAKENLTFDLIFDASNAGKKYVGISGKTYVMSVSSDNKSLFAALTNSTSSRQVVATISYDGITETVDHEKIAYKETQYAKDLLNYKAHNALDNNTIKAIVGLKAVNKCNKTLALTNNTFDVRFLRPINITNTTANVEDASTTELQTINLMNLLTFTDWRDAWKNGYATYYGIQGVKIAGVDEGAKISTNADVLTNQNGNTSMVPLQKVNGAIDFTYSSNNMGQLTYKNYNSTTADFKVQVPVVVSYIWGDVPQTITINVKHTHSNAK